MGKKAFITGISGQTGSYLSEYLLKNGYEVYGMVRRHSVAENQSYRLNHIMDDIKLHYGDVTDASNVFNLINQIKPDEIYNLAAQSHVRISFDMPSFTNQVNTQGFLNILEAVRCIDSRIKIYQASSSEMFGNNIDSDGFQRITTQMNPVSPYGCSKLASHNLANNYRNSYNMFIVSGILFNHETVLENMPLFMKTQGETSFDIKPINEIVDFINRNNKIYQSGSLSELQVWGKYGWTNVKYASAYPHDLKDNKNPKLINSRNGVYAATSSHVAFLENNIEKNTNEIVLGDNMEEIVLPSSNNIDLTSLEESELIGMMVGDGCISYNKKGIGVHGKFTNKDKNIRDRFEYLWKNVTKGSFVLQKTPSGFNKNKYVEQMCLNGGNDWLRKYCFYNKDKTKRIPKEILNGSYDVKIAFLNGYNQSDGLKKNKCVYKYKNFKTNSITLAAGLFYLIKTTTNQKINISVESRKEKFYYSLNILSPKVFYDQEKINIVKKLIDEKIPERKISEILKISRKIIQKIKQEKQLSIKSHLEKGRNEVKKIINLDNYDGWFYDLETESGEFCCGIGNIHVHNSPRRGTNFVTAKVVNSAVNIKKGLDFKLALGNLNASRDWGHASDYAKAQHAMMQNDFPKDYVVASGESHTIHDLCDYVFSSLGMNYKDYVVLDKNYLRPEELNNLKGDSNPIKLELGWKPDYNFETLLDEMIQHRMDKHE